MVLAIIGLGLCVQARSENLSTKDGATYNNITAQRVDPDGLYIEYTPAGGGVGASKVKFSRLSSDEQKQYGYDPDKAKDFEAKVAKATEDFRQDCIRREQTAQTQRTSDQELDDQRDKALTDRITAMAHLKEAEAELARATGGSENGGYGWGGGEYPVVAIPEIGRAPRARTDYAPVVTPVPFPRLNTPNFSRSSGERRP